MTDTDVARGPGRPIDSIRQQLFAECEAMTSFALASGIVLPETVRANLFILAEGDHRTSAADDTARLGLLHGQLAQLVHPAKPNTLRLLREERMVHPFWRILGPLPSVRRLVAAAIAFGTTFIVTSVSPTISSEILQKDIYSSSGSELLIVLTFLLSAAGLGALFNVLYGIAQSLSDGSYDPRGESFAWISVSLGLMAGLLLCELIPLNTGPESSTLIKPVVALLGGFSASLLYRILGRLVETVANLFEASSADRSRLQEQEWRLRAVEQSREERARTAAALVDALGRVTATGGKADVEQVVRSVLDTMEGRPAVGSAEIITAPDLEGRSQPLSSPAVTLTLAPVPAKARDDGPKAAGGESGRVTTGATPNQ